MLVLMHSRVVDTSPHALSSALPGVGGGALQPRLPRHPRRQGGEREGLTYGRILACAYEGLLTTHLCLMMDAPQVTKLFFDCRCAVHPVQRHQAWEEQSYREHGQRVVLPHPSRLTSSYYGYDSKANPEFHT